ncbi:MAG: muconolactone Delta-isomerase family protein [Bacteroidota bacterium]
MGKFYRYMVQFNFGPFNLEMEEMIPRQRLMVDRLFDQGVLITYTLAADRSKLWAVFQSDSESELLSYIESLPMTKYCDYTYNEIMFHDSSQFIPSISLN